MAAISVLDSIGLALIAVLLLAAAVAWRYRPKDRFDWLHWLIGISAVVVVGLILWAILVYRQ